MGHKNENLIFHNMAKVNDFLWFWELKEDALFKTKWNGLSADIVNLQCYREEKHTTSRYGKMEKYENKLIGVPLSADEILIYDCDTGIDKYIPLPKHIFGEEYANRGKFWDIVIDGENAYFIGYWTNKIVKFDLIEEKISAIIEPNIEKTVSGKEIYFKKAGLFKNYLIVPSCRENIIYVINKDSMEYKVKECRGTDDGFASLLIDGCNIWLSPRRGGKFLRWNPETDRMNYLNCPEECKTERPSYGFLEKIGNDIFAFPLHARAVLRINSETLEIQIDSKWTEICGRNDDEIQKTGFTEFEGTELIVYSWKESSFIKYDTKTCLIQKNRVKYADAFYISFIKKEIEINGYVNEKNYCPLDIFIRNVDEIGVSCEIGVADFHRRAEEILQALVS